MANHSPEFVLLPDTTLLEQGILARLMREPELLNSGHLLHPEHFQDSRLKEVARAIKYIHEGGGSPAVQNVVLRLSETGELKRIGGAFALTGFGEYESSNIQGDLAELQKHCAKRLARTLLYRGFEDINGMSPEEIAAVGKELQEIVHDIHRKSPLTAIIPEPQDLWSMVANTDNPPEDVIVDILPLEGILEIYGIQKVGKSLLAMNLAHNLAAGEDWYSLEIPQARKTIYISIEGGYWTLHRRATTMWDGEVSPKQGMLALHPSKPFDILDPSDFATLDGILEALDPQVIVLDPLVKAHRANEIDNSEMSRVMDGLRSLITAKGRSMVFTHHARKGGDSSRGASAIAGDVDAIIRLEWANSNDHGGPRRLYFEDIRHAEAPSSLYLDLDPMTLTFTSDKSGQDIVAQFLFDNAEMTRKDLVQRIEAETGRSQAWAYGQVKAAEKEGRIEINPATKKMRLKSP